MAYSFVVIVAAGARYMAVVSSSLLHGQQTTAVQESKN